MGIVHYKGIKKELLRWFMINHEKKAHTTKTYKVPTGGSPPKEIFVFSPRARGNTLDQDAVKLFCFFLIVLDK